MISPNISDYVSYMRRCHNGWLNARLHGSPQVDQRGWINQSELCKQCLSTEVINGVDGWTRWRWPTFVQRRWFTLGDSPQITRINRRWLTTDYPYQQAVTQHRLPVSTGGDSPQITLINRRWLTTDYPCKQVSHDLFPIVERVVLVCDLCF